MLGWSELIFGSMYCGKSEELMRRLKRSKIGNQNVMLFKPMIDNRYGENIVATHASNKTSKKIKNVLNNYIKGHEFDIAITNAMMEEINSTLEGSMVANVVLKSSEILKHVTDDVQVIGIDEVQFFDDELIDVIEILKNSGKRVICAGLDMYANGKPFGNVIPYLACTSKLVDKLHAVCTKCGQNAMYSYKTNNNNYEQSMIDIGSEGKYIAVCEKCLNELINK